ncbi:hypothetical protein D1007_15770 [Hordeum vulgare]|nr:hypothetical protein D1007_15770 [Hordeum vulgare]
MDGKTTPHLLPLSLSEAKKKIRDAVPLVCGWVLLSAFTNAGGYAADYIAHYYHFVCSQSSFIMPCIELTDAEAARVTALFIGTLCCAPAQAAAAAAALLLPCRRRRGRRALAYLALTVTVLCHCMQAGTVWVFLAADPGYIFGWIYFPAGYCFFAVCDFLSFRALLGGDGWGMHSKTLNQALAMSSSGASQPSLTGRVTENLSCTNYVLWCAPITPQLRGAGVFGYVDGTSLEPAKFLIAKDKDSKETAEPNPLYPIWV